MKVMFLSEARISFISLPEVAAQVPFSTSATVRFCRLCAHRSCITVSIVTNIPAL